ncbi:hypothetical protein DFH28DRAFT_17100 [Melampsora americana]|nr:hypothetical protein DFH28DRAFT_17100 [Melampsora americana]
MQVKLELNAIHSDLNASRATNNDQLTTIDQLTGELEKTKATLKRVVSEAKAQTDESQDIASLREALQNAREEGEQTRTVFQATTEDLTTKFEHFRERHEAEVKQHIEEKTKLQNELAAMKEVSQGEATRIEMQQSMINEFTEDIQQEISKRQAAEAEVKQLRAANGTTGAPIADSKLTELHDAHNAKTAELESKLEQYKHMATMAEQEALEMKEKYELLEHLMHKQESQTSHHLGEAEYEGDTTVDQSAVLDQEKTRNLIDMSFDEA